MTKKTIVITGASSGIGEATARVFQKKDWNVAATMRKPEEHKDLAELENVKCYRLDVTKNETINEVVKNSISDFGKIDVVLNNAGYGLMGAFELATEKQIKKQFDTNLFGIMNVTRAFLPHFRQNKDGIFVNISSIGGLVTLPLVSLYHSTKWAVEGFSESLSYELSRFGIKVKIIEPGAIKTDFGTRSLDWTSKENIKDYDKSIAHVQLKFQEMMKPENMTSAEQTAEAIFEATIDDSDKIRYLIGGDAEQFWNLRKKMGDTGFVGIMKQQFLDVE